MSNHQFSSIKNVELNGFQGFVSWSHLRKNSYREIPKLPGVYIVLLPDGHEIEFLNKSVGGFFNGKDPTASIEVLKANWVPKTPAIYIGKAIILRDRLALFSRFGMGKPAPHSGGRLIWQIKTCENLVVCWRVTGYEDPRIVEFALIGQFKKIYGGRRPFANLAD